MVRPTHSTAKFLRKPTFLVGLVIIVLIAGLLIHHYHKPTAIKYPIPTETKKVNLGPPTNAQKQESANAKSAVINNGTPTSGSSSSSKKSVSPFITSVDETNGVKSYVPGIAEDGGSCTATFTQGNSEFTKTSSGFANATDTVCSPIKFSRSDFSASGTWAVVVTYNSSSAQGSSQTVNIEVQ